MLAFGFSYHPWIYLFFNVIRQLTTHQGRYFLKCTIFVHIVKCSSSQSYGFSSSHIWMWELDHRERWTQKNWCFWTVVLEKPLESPLDCKEIKSVNPKRNQSWIFIGSTDAEASILWPTDAKNWLIGKDPDDGKDWRQEKKGMGMTEDEMVGWHHWLNGHEFKQTLGDGEGQESVVCCSPWGCKETWLNKRLDLSSNTFRENDSGLVLSSDLKTKTEPPASRTRVSAAWPPPFSIQGKVGGLRWTLQHCQSGISATPSRSHFGVDYIDF